MWACLPQLSTSLRCLHIIYTPPGLSCLPFLAPGVQSPDAWQAELPARAADGAWRAAGIPPRWVEGLYNKSPSPSHVHCIGLLVLIIHLLLLIIRLLVIIIHLILLIIRLLLLIIRLLALILGVQGWGWRGTTWPWCQLPRGWWWWSRWSSCRSPRPTSPPGGGWRRGPGPSPGSGASLWRRPGRW